MRCHVSGAIAFFLVVDLVGGGVVSTGPTSSS